MALVARLRTSLTWVPLRLRVIVLGLLSWALCATLPALHRPEGIGALDVLALSAGPLTLGIGSLLEAKSHRSAPAALLSAFPIALALGVSSIDHDHALSTFAPSTLLVAIASLLAYGVSALALCGQAVELRAVDHKPLGEVAPVEPETRRQRFGAIVLSIVTAGVLVILTFGTWASPARYREYWGTSAAAGAALTALSAGIAGAVAIALVAPGLRAERSEPLSREALLRKLGWLSLVALSGLVVYTLSQLSR